MRFVKNSSSIAVVSILSFVLTGCSTTSTELESRASTSKAVFEYSYNYQEIYRRLSTTAKRCSSGNIYFSLAASFEVDAELYPDLGYGEVTFSLLNVGVRNYYWSARIDKVGSGSRVTVSSGNTLRNATSIEKVKQWADGNTAC